VVNIMRYLAATLLALISAQAWANELDSLLQQAQVLGGPMAAVQRAIQDLAPADLSKKDVDSFLQQAGVLGAPMAAVQRAIQISRQPIFPKKDVLAVFDISQPSRRKDSTFWISNQVRSRPTTRPMEETMDPTQEPSNLKASRRIWTWCRWARLKPLIPK
jgi:hypothetical protein